SGTTITALLLVNIDSDDAFKGSFIMAVPAIIGAIVLDLFDLIFMENSISALVEEPTGIIVGIIFSAIFGFITMRSLLKIANNFDFSKIVLFLGIFILIYLVLISI
ncbi:MAG: undecaprenyl-diphosphate phosphatase, partial [Candidatus Heimdallarchaeota archaeon]